MIEGLFSEIESIASQPSAEAGRIVEILEGARETETVSLRDAWQLLSVDVERQPELAAEVLATARQVKARHFGGAVFGISPLYVSSICREHCVYCNFRVENKDKAVTRVRLTPEQLREEVSFLVNRHGLRVVELVYASDPEADADAVAEHVRLTDEVLAQAGGGIVGLNSAPFEADEYRQLKEAGLDFVVLWQETYDQARYRELHPIQSPKGDFAGRVTAYERMIKGGIRNIGLGVLSGLAPWREDWLALLAHEQYLHETHGVKTAILGVPRLKGAKGAAVQNTEYVPTDQEYLLSLAVHNLFSPLTIPFVNTREPWDLCLEAVRGGGALFTFNCATIPGGYTQGTKGYQFPTGDFAAAEYLPKLQAEGFDPVMKWTFEGIQAGAW
jgi:2-iminoacetate synthase